MMRRSLALALAAMLAQAQSSAPPPAAPRPVAETWMHSLTLSRKVAQLVFVPFYGDSPNPNTKAYRDFVSLVRDVRIGGMIVLNRVRDGSVQRAEPYAMASFLNRMQRIAKVPLMIGGDFERGASMRMSDTAPFPHAMAFGAAGDVEFTRNLGRATARESRAMGVHWIYAPVADVNNNPDNPVINIRSFGEDPEAVAAHVRAFIEGAHSDPANKVLVTVKHFPGHGDTATDSHFGLGRVTGSRARLDSVELAPFKAAIAAGVDSVMTAHLAVEALEPDEIPATVSKRVLTGVLRKDLGFKGIISTDAMDMRGLTNMYPAGEAAVRALEAGADVLLIPSDPRAAVAAVVAAVKQGRLKESRVDESVRKLLAAKARLGLHRKRTVDLERLGESLDTGQDNALAASVAQHALTLVRNEGGVLPLKHPASACFYLLSGSRFSTLGRELQDELQQAISESRVRLLDPQLPERVFNDLAEEAAKCDTVVVAAYVTATAYKGNVALPGRYPAFVSKIVESERPVVFIAVGNPYLLRAFPQVEAYLATFSNVEPSEQAIVRALLGEAPITGRMPVSIPGLAKVGDGIQLPQQQQLRPREKK